MTKPCNRRLEVGMKYVQKNEKIKFVNSDLLQKIEKSLVLDIFGGIIRTEFHVEGSREHTVRFETSFVLSLDIINDECTIEDCLDRFFENNVSKAIN